jgi:FxLD family lantipeptide
VLNVLPNAGIALLDPVTDQECDDPWGPLDVRVVAGTTQLPNNCTTGDGCGQTCNDGASACVSSAFDPF